MLSLLDKACVGYSKLGLALMSYGWKAVVAYWVAQIAGMVALYVYTDMFWYVLIGWNIVAAVMMWRAGVMEQREYVQQQVDMLTATILDRAKMFEGGVKC